jgi:hypothetical protein
MSGHESRLWWHGDAKADVWMGMVALYTLQRRYLEHGGTYLYDIDIDEECINLTGSSRLLCIATPRYQ